MLASVPVEAPYTVANAIISPIISMNNIMNDIVRNSGAWLCNHNSTLLLAGELVCLCKSAGIL